MSDSQDPYAPNPQYDDWAVHLTDMLFDPDAGIWHARGERHGT